MDAEQRKAALVAEAGRIKARLDTLDRILAGSADEWLGIQEKLGSEVAEVTINAPLAEARQQALALATITKTLATLAGEDTGQAPAGDPSDEVAKRRQEKLDAARKASQS